MARKVSRRITATPLYIKAENLRLDTTKTSVYPATLLPHNYLSQYASSIQATTDQTHVKIEKGFH
jgi:hypothetical protein